MQFITPAGPRQSLLLAKEPDQFFVKTLYTLSEVKLLSRVRLFATPWTVAYQASQSMGFSMQEYWSGLPFPSPGDLPNSGIKLGSPVLEADSLMLSHLRSSNQALKVKVKVKVKSLSSVRLFGTPWTVAYQASQSMGFSRQEYWSRLPFPSPGDLPDPGIKPRSPTL